MADLFSEEDLTRHLQIMLRTHGELGYKQEQRFHLELGLLKMAHAQRLIPLEQLLSDVSAAPPAGLRGRPPGRQSWAAALIPRHAVQSPLPLARIMLAPSLRFGEEGNSAPGGFHGIAPLPGPRIVAQASQPEPVIMGSAAPATQREANAVAESREEESYLDAAVAIAEPDPQPETEIAPEIPAAISSPVSSDPIERLQAQSSGLDRCQPAHPRFDVIVRRLERPGQRSGREGGRVADGR